MCKSDLLFLRRQFAGLPVSAHKQIGLRNICHALQMLGRNEARVAECVALAKFHLPKAQAKA